MVIGAPKCFAFMTWAAGTNSCGVSQFAVELTGIENEIQLVVNDAGAGFDVEEAKKNRGLGLLSMQERIHLVHGRFSVNSKPGQGTRIIAAVPLIGENKWVPDRTQTTDKIPPLRMR
jgi:signal transduction histidine kinase